MGSGLDCCCCLDVSGFLRTVLILDNNLLPIPFPFSSLPSPCNLGNLEVMLLVRVVRYLFLKAIQGSNGTKSWSMPLAKLSRAGSRCL